VLVDHFRPENIQVCETYMDVIEGWPSMLRIPGATDTIELYVAKLKAIPGHTREFERAQNLLAGGASGAGEDTERDFLISDRVVITPIALPWIRNNRETCIVLFLMASLLVLSAVSIFYGSGV
jgi:hypothetical protein